MAQKVIASKKGSLQWRDIVRGVLMAALTSALVVVQTSIERGELTFNWKVIGMAAVGGGVAYLLKNWLLEPPKVIVTTDNNEQAKNLKDNLKN